MRFLEIVLNLFNRILTLVLVVAMLLMGGYASYGLWDNNRIYNAADNVRDDMIQFKPEIYEPSFEELLAINKDVKAWITMDNTNIDYPVLQGKTNLTYFNTDVFGDFSLAGSIYLDSRNSDDFSDSYSLLYGHHMHKSKMFGDLDLYKEEKFFKENKTGVLILPSGSFKLEVFATLVVRSGEQAIFNPLLWTDGTARLMDFTEESHLFIRQELVDRIRANPDDRVLALTTCANEFTDARTVVLALMVPYDQ